MNTHVRTELRLEIVTTLKHWVDRTELSFRELCAHCELPYAKFLRWRKRAAAPQIQTRKVIPKSHWLLPTETQAILDFSLANPGHGYRRLT